MRGPWSCMGAVVVVLTACANGAEQPSEVTEGAATSPDELGTIGGFCDALARASCSDAVLKACGVKSATCIRARAALCASSVPQGTAYVTDKAAACIAVARPAHADATLSGDEMRAMQKACEEDIFSGPGAARAPCRSPFDCASADGLACIKAPGEMDGRCLVPRVVQIGQPCPGEADVCTPATFCDAKAKTCKTRMAEGNGCHPWLQPCGEGLVCPGINPFGVQCKAKSAAGVPCLDATACASGLCDKARGQSEGTCVDAIVLSTLSAACGPFEEARSN